MEKITYRNKFLRKLDIAFSFKSDEIKIPKRIEKIIHENGSIGWDKVHKKWVKGNFNELTDDDNDYTTYVCRTLSSYPETYELKNHEEVIVCGNNSLYKTDLDELDWFSEMLSETDVSIYYQLINSRNIPMLQVNDDNTRTEVQKAFNDRKAGVPVVTLASLMSDIKTLDITDPSSIDKISTLDNFHEELIKRWCTSYGIEVTTKEKKAQVNSEELESFSDFDTLNFLEMYQARLEFVKEMQTVDPTFTLVRNSIYWDEPDETDVENGTFKKEEENEDDQNISEEKNLNDQEDPKGTEETK